MRIVCCIKQVPATDSVRFDPEKGTLIREGIRAEINPYDLFALEMAVSLKEASSSGSSEVIALSMGPPQAEEAIKEAVSRGADRGYLLCDKRFAGSDTLATSYILSQAIAHIGGADLVVCGRQTTDGDTAQVGPGIAMRLNAPCATGVLDASVSDDGIIAMKRVVDDKIYRIKCALPMVITVEIGANTPRMPSLKGKMRAKKMDIPVLDADTIGADEGRIGLQGSPTRLSSTYVPEFRGRHEVIECPSDEAADRILSLLKDFGAI